MNFLEELRKRHGLTQQALAEQAQVGKSTMVKIEAGSIQPRTDTAQRLATVLRVKPQELIVRLKKDADDRVTVDSQLAQRRREIVVEELSSPALPGDVAEALIFIALVRLFQSRLRTCLVRPEVYAGYVEAGRQLVSQAEHFAQLVDQAEHLGRALFCEGEANHVTNDELGIHDPRQMTTTLRAFHRWRLTHAPELEQWAGVLPDWSDDFLAELAASWEQQLSNNSYTQDESFAGQDGDLAQDDLEVVQ
jgi:transcriptional regulator with XRE-family HTH domain